MTASWEKVAVLVVNAIDWQELLQLQEEYGRDQITLNVRSQGPRRELATSAVRRLCLVSTGEHIVALGLITSQGRSGDLDLQVRVNGLSQLDESVAMPDLLRQLPARVAWWANPVLLGGGVLAPQAGAEVLTGISHLNPQAGLVLRELAVRLRPRPRRLMSVRQQLHEEQRDAVALGLELSGFDSRELVPSPDPEPPAAPFLSGLRDSARGASEASVIRHDASLFPGWIPAEATVHDVVEFVDPYDSTRRVTVLYADKEDEEVVTGTDLIYYRAQRPGYVLVQYKRMRYDDAAPAGRQWAYRPDRQLQIEVERMRAIASEGSMGPPAGGPGHADDWRFSTDPFFMKLVEDGRARPEGSRLVSGMYMPLGLFEALLTSDAVRGPRGGAQIGWHNAGRWLDSTQFLDLMIEGWIGSSADLTDHLTDILNHTLMYGRGAIVVRDDSLSPRPRRRRR